MGIIQTLKDGLGKVKDAGAGYAEKAGAIYDNSQRDWRSIAKKVALCSAMIAVGCLLVYASMHWMGDGFNSSNVMGQTPLIAGAGLLMFGGIGLVAVISTDILKRWNDNNARWKKMVNITTAIMRIALPIIMGIYCVQILQIVNASVFVGSASAANVISVGALGMGSIYFLCHTFDNVRDIRRNAIELWDMRSKGPAKRRIAAHRGERTREQVQRDRRTDARHGASLKGRVTASADGH